MRSEPIQLKRDFPETQLNLNAHQNEAGASSQTPAHLPKKQRTGDTVGLQRGLQTPTEVAQLSKSLVVTEPGPPGIPPAIWACINNDIQALKGLIAQGVDLEETAGGRFNPPLHRALENFNAEIVQLLLAHGASLEAEDIVEYTVIEAARSMSKKYSGEVVDKILHMIENEAARRGCTGI